MGDGRRKFKFSDALGRVLAIALLILAFDLAFLRGSGVQWPGARVGTAGGRTTGASAGADETGTGVTEDGGSGGGKEGIGVGRALLVLAPVAVGLGIGDEAAEGVIDFEFETDVGVSC